jgi:hypothetical protein
VKTNWIQIGNTLELNALELKQQGRPQQREEDQLKFGVKTRGVGAHG